MQARRAPHTTGQALLLPDNAKRFRTIFDLSQGALESGPEACHPSSMYSKNGKLGLGLCCSTPMQPITGERRRPKRLKSHGRRLALSFLCFFSLSATPSKRPVLCTPMRASVQATCHLHGDSPTKAEAKSLQLLRQRRHDGRGIRAIDQATGHPACSGGRGTIANCLLAKPPAMTDHGFDGERGLWTRHRFEGVSALRAIVDGD